MRAKRAYTVGGLGGVAEADAERGDPASGPRRPGLTSAARAAPSAYWAAWADALPLLRERSPLLPNMCVRLLTDGGGHAPSLQSAAEARELHLVEGWQEFSSWATVAEGARPPRSSDEASGIGSTMHRVYAASTFARARCYPPCRHPNSPFSGHKLPPRPEHG